MDMKKIKHDPIMLDKRISVVRVTKNSPYQDLFWKEHQNSTITTVLMRTRKSVIMVNMLSDDPNAVLLLLYHMDVLSVCNSRER